MITRRHIIRGVLVFIVAAMLPSATSLAQAPEDLEILSAEYSAAEGTLALELRVGGSRDIPVQQLTVLVDGAPRTVAAQTDSSGERPAVLLVIDTSGSMAGTPIVAAREASRGLVEQLSEGDTVGVLTFASSPSIRVPLATGLASVSAALGGLQAEGGTALYDAITVGLATLAGAPAPRAMVLLSDGEESGVSSSSVDEVWDAVAAADVTIHSFALGETAPGEFLRALSDETGGSFWSVASDSALEELFLALGGRLGASRSASVEVPGLGAGDHDVLVRARVGGEAVQADATFTVLPAAALDLSVVPPSTPDRPVAVEVSIRSTADVHLTATLQGASGGVTLAGTRVLVDPWEVPPGEYVLLVEAWIMGRAAAAETIAVTVPTLAPALEVTRTGDGDWRAVGRAQARAGEAGSTRGLVALVDGQVVAEADDGEMTFSGPETAAELVVQLRRAGSEPVLSRQFSLQGLDVGSEAQWGLVFPLALALALCAVAAGVAIWRRRGRRAAPVRPLVRRRSIDPAGEPAQTQAARAATLNVVAPDGSSRTFAIGPRPLRAGTTAQADIRLSGEGLRAEHARFALTASGELRVHGIALRGARPYDGNALDEWVVVRPGEEIAIGDWRFSLAKDDPEQEALDG